MIRSWPAGEAVITALLGAWGCTCPVVMNERGRSRRSGPRPRRCARCRRARQGPARRSGTRWRGPRGRSAARARPGPSRVPGWRHDSPMHVNSDQPAHLARGVKTGVASSTLGSQWRAAEIFPVARNALLTLAPAQVGLLWQFAGQKQ